MISDQCGKCKRGRTVVEPFPLFHELKQLLAPLNIAMPTILRQDNPNVDTNTKLT
jgi:hypothetical protein